jgi:hypothetical protein
MLTIKVRKQLPKVIIIESKMFGIILFSAYPLKYPPNKTWI